MNFRKNFEIGGGVISDPKNFVANSVLVVKILEKIATFFPKKGGGGGGQRPFGTFPKIHRYLIGQASLMSLIVTMAAYWLSFQGPKKFSDSSKIVEISSFRISPLQPSGHPELAQAHQWTS